MIASLDARRLPHWSRNYTDEESTITGRNANLIHFKVFPKEALCSHFTTQIIVFDIVNKQNKSICNLKVFRSC